MALYKLPGTLSLTKGTGEGTKYEVKSTMSFAVYQNQEIIEATTTEKNCTLKWSSAPSGLIYKIRFTIGAYGYLAETGIRGFKWTLYVGDKKQDSGEIDSLQKGDSYYYIEDPIINWSQTVAVNEGLSNSERYIPITFELTDIESGDDVATYTGNIELPKIFLNLKYIDTEISSRQITMAEGETDDNKQTVSISYDPSVRLYGYLKYSRSGEKIGSLSVTSTSTQSEKQSLTVYHYSQDELKLQGTFDTVILVLSLAEAYDSYYLLGNSEEEVTSYTVIADPNYVTKNLHIESEQRTSGSSSGYSYPSSWGYLQNISGYYMKVTFWVPITRTGEIYIKVYDNDNRVYSSTVDAVTVGNSPLASNTNYREVTAEAAATFTESGDHTIKYTFTDSGNAFRTASSVSTERNFTVVPYQKPSIQSLQVYRATRDGSAGAITEKVDSPFIAFTAKWTISSVNNNNTTVSRKIECRQTVSDDTIVHTINENYINNGVETYYYMFKFDTAYTYPLTFTITDGVGFTATYTVNLPPAQVFLDFKAGGKGMGIGKVAENDALEVQFPTVFYGDVQFTQGLDLGDQVDIPGLTSRKVDTDALDADNANLGNAVFNSNSMEINEPATFTENVVFSGDVSGVAGGLVDQGFYNGTTDTTKYSIYYMVHKLGPTGYYITTEYYEYGTLSNLSSRDITADEILNKCGYTPYGTSSYPLVMTYAAQQLISYRYKPLWDSSATIQVKDCYVNQGEIELYNASSSSATYSIAIRLSGVVKIYS